MSMVKIKYVLPKPRRVYIVAQELGVPSRVLIEELRDLGLTVHSASSNLEGVLAETVAWYVDTSARFVGAVDGSDQ